MKYYITTTIPYANAPPHIGFALEIIQADVLARWHRLKGDDVFFLTGTDEHGVKNYQTAKKEGLSPKEFVDKNSEKFRELTKKMNISNDYFIRTTDKKVHWPGVFEMWKLLEEKGDIYKKKYTGCYCYGCERFVTEKDLVNGKCPDHPNLKIETINEENYFFKLSRYSEKIKELIKTNKIKIFPEQYKNEFLMLIKDGLTDVSFSRDKNHLPWGIPVPNDNNQVMYVWPDALTNYLTGIGFPDKKYKKYWPADVHVVGKDMLRFHTGIWPGMLLSAGIELPKKVIVHGFLTVGGQKMSKSLGNVVSPLNLLDKYSSDIIRYVLMRTTPFGQDGDFSEEALIKRNNAELADALGNLLNRVVSMCEKYFDSKIPKGREDKNLSSKLDFKKIDSFVENYELHNALNEIWHFVDECNKYTNEKEPWTLAKNNKQEELQLVLFNLAEGLRLISQLIYPFMPETSEKINEQLGFKLRDKFDLKWGNGKSKSIKKGETLFKKI